MACEGVLREVELENLDAVAESGRDVAVEGVPGDDESLECGEVADGWGERTLVARAAFQAESDDAGDVEHGRAAVDARRAGFARVEGEVPGGDAGGGHDGGCVQCQLHLQFEHTMPTSVITIQTMLCT